MSTSYSSFCNVPPSVEALDLPNSPLEVSFVVPLHNEEANVDELVSQVKLAGDRLGRSYELIAVDDGSKDSTLLRLKALQKEQTFLSVLPLARCYGQSAALKAGFDAARGRYIITLDGDLQNNPADAPKMLERLIREELGLVSGWRKDRQDATITRNFPSWVANRLIAKTTGAKFHDIGCGLKVYRAEVAKRLSLYGEMHRFLPVLAFLSGASVGEEPVSHQPRQFGESKYGLERTFKVLLDLMTVVFLHKFIARPLHWFGRIGMVWLGFACVLGLALLVAPWLQGLPTLVVGIGSLMCLVAAWFSLALGLLAELLARTYFESQGRPPYALKVASPLKDTQATQEVEAMA